MILIAAADLNNGIGFKNSLLYDIPEDKKFFKEKTIGGAVVMGRKTYESLPVKPLPKRQNIIMTRNNDTVYEDAVSVHSTEELLKYISDLPEDKVFVIGGAEIYSKLLPFCSTAYITRIYDTRSADRFIPDFDILEGWQPVEKSEIKEYNGIRYQFIKYSKKITLDNWKMM